MRICPQVPSGMSMGAWLPHYTSCISLLPPAPWGFLQICNPAVIHQLSSSPLLALGRWGLTRAPCSPFPAFFLCVLPEYILASVQHSVGGEWAPETLGRKEPPCPADRPHFLLSLG